MQAFVRVVDAGSFAAAARQLGLSRAMVSRLVGQLEDALATRLLYRTTRKVSLTEAGRAYHDRATALLDELQSLDSSVQDLASEARGVLRVNAPNSFGVLQIAPLLPEFLTRHPRARIELTLNDRVVNLVEEGYDLAVRIGHMGDSSLIARRLADIRMLVCASPAYLAQHGTPSHPDALRTHNCLAYTYAAAGNQWHFEGREGPLSVRVSGNLEANSGDATLAAGLAGLGVMLQPSFIVAEALKSGALVELLQDFRVASLPLQVVYPHRRHLTTKLRLFIDYLALQLGHTPPQWEQALK